MRNRTKSHLLRQNLLRTTIIRPKQPIYRLILKRNAYCVKSKKLMAANRQKNRIGYISTIPISDLRLLVNTLNKSIKELTEVSVVAAEKSNQRTADEVR